MVSTPASKQLTHLADHNVVAAFADVETGRQALESLRRDGFGEDELSVLARDEAAPRAESDSFEESDLVAHAMASGAAKGGLTGAGVGGMAGFIAGGMAFGIPGIGPAVGAGIWATTAGAAAAGGMAGGLVGAFGSMWDARFRELVKEGDVLVGVHVADRDRAAHALALLAELSPTHVAHFDREGAVITQR